jgi:hypothetical protein
MRYYMAAYTASEDGIWIDEDWLKQIAPQIFCSGCRNEVPGSGLLSVVLADAPPDKPENGCARPDFQVIRHDMMRVLQSFGSGDFETIPLLDRQGKQVEGFTAIRLRKIKARGAATSDYFGRCALCGRVYYWPRPREGWYVLRPSIADRRAIYQLQTGPLLVSEELKAGLIAAGIEGMEYEELPVVDEPCDGLPADLSISDKIYTPEPFELFYRREDVE